jgi:tetratricopeptide (TPR) repeat protein
VKRFTWLALIVLAILSLRASDTEAQNHELEEGFFRANQAYKEGHYKEAAKGYEQLIQSGLRNGHIYYNLGNAYFRQNQVGRAILNYERARLLMPRDPDLNFNLRNARDQTQDAIPESQSFMSMTFFWLDHLTLDEVFLCFAVLNVLFWTVVWIRLFFQWEWTYYLSITLLIFWAIAALCFGLKWYQDRSDDRAVILQKEVRILAGPETADTVLFKLHEGTLVHCERSEDGWILVHLPDKKRGWVKAEALERIRQR